MADLLSGTPATWPVAGARWAAPDLAGPARAPAVLPVGPLGPRTVERVMRARPPVVGPDDGLAAAAARMRLAGVGALPVMESGRLVGLITDRDIVRAVADGLSTDVLRVSGYARPVPCVVPPASALEEAAARMVELRVRHLVVVRDGDVVGLLSAGDVLGEWGVPRELLGDAQRRP